jgi:SPP1 gp7 family putative phage head morphogenesis protein
MAVKLEPLPPQEAIKFFEQKGLVLTESWDDLWAEMHAKAFTVAGVMLLDVLADIYEQVKKAIEKGTTLEEFKKSFQEIMQRRGWYDPEFKRPWRLETIFRTNIQTAYMAGRYKQQKEMADLRPYWMYDAVNDSRTRPTHRAMDGKVFRADDPIWDRWYPPNGFNCRCRVISLSERQVKRRGLKVSRGKDVKVRPDRGWEYNPGKEVFQPDIERCRKKYKKIFGTLPFVVEQELAKIDIGKSILDFGEQILKETQGRYEIAGAFNAKGTQILKKRGGKNFVFFTEEEIEKIKGADYLVHNHPRSTSFSPRDILLGLKYNIKKLVIFSEKYVYLIDLTKGVKDIKVVKKTIETIEKEVHKEFRQKIEQGILSKEEAILNYFHEVNCRLAKVMSYFYVRIKR